MVEEVVSIKTTTDQKTYAEKISELYTNYRTYSNSLASDEMITIDYVVIYISSSGVRLKLNHTDQGRFYSKTDPGFLRFSGASYDGVKFTISHIYANNTSTTLYATVSVNTSGSVTFNDYSSTSTYAQITLHVTKYKKIT